MSLRLWRSSRPTQRQFTTFRVLSGNSKPWSEAEVERLQRLSRQGLSRREIALQIPGRSNAAVSGQLWIILSSPDKTKATALEVRKWSTDEDRRLLELARRPERTQEAVERLISFAAEPYYASAHAQQHWIRDETAQIAALREAGETWSSIQSKFPQLKISTTAARYFRIRRFKRAQQEKDLATETKDQHLRK